MRAVMALVLGIDPGLNGACCLLDVADGAIVTCGIHRMPVVQSTVNKRVRRSYDLAAINAFCRDLPTNVGLALLERQWARPGEGVSSACSTCFGYGLWRAMLVAWQVSHREVSPITWRKALGIPSALSGVQRKRAVRDLCQQRIPGAGHIALPLADAVGIALAATITL
jgi:hypothetical protein